MRPILSLFLIVVAASYALAVGAPDYLPDGQHPRIFLTAAELVRLNDKQGGSHADWTELEAWCDAHIADAGYDTGDAAWQGNNDYLGYRMSGYQKHLLNYALAYQVLKDDNPTKAATYAQRVRDLLINGIAVGLKAGEENNGLGAVRWGESADRTINASEATALGISGASYKLGYAARYSAAVPIAYDWIVESGVLSASDNATIHGMMFRWFDWIRGVRSTSNNGVLVSGTRYHEDQGGDCAGSNNCTSESGASTMGYGYGTLSHNFGNGELYLMALVPVATYGDNTAAADYLTDFKAVLSGTVLAQGVDNDLFFSGGDAVEGWGYGSGYGWLAPGLYGYYTATGDNTVSSLPWFDDLMGSMIGRLATDYKSMPIYGDWSGGIGLNRNDYVQTFAGIIQRLDPTSYYSTVGQYLIDNVIYGTEDRELWQKMLWYRTDITAATPSISPLYHHAKGVGFVTSRSTWGNNAIHFSARLEGKMSADHESMDEGHFAVTRGTDRLLVHQNYTTAPQSHNTIVFHDGNQTAEQTLVVPSIDRIANDNTYYFYVSGDITTAFDGGIFNDDRALLFRRSFLHIRPNYIVVYDHTRSNMAYDATHTKEWYSQYGADPSISGSTIASTVGSSKVFVQTMYPTGGTYTETNPAAGYWRVKYAPASMSEYQQWLHVVEALDNTASQTTATLISGTGGRGVVIADGTENKIAMFSDNQVAGDIASLSYTANTTAASRHFISNLTPNTSYGVSIDGGASSGYVANSAGIIMFTSAPTSSHDYVVAQVDLTPSAFSYTDVTGAALSTQYTTDNVTVAGIDNQATLTLTGTGCEYSINGAAWATANDNVSLNDNVALRGTSSGSYSTTYPSCTLTIGGVSDTWTVRTLDAVSDPVAPRMRAGDMSGGWR